MLFAAKIEADREPIVAAITIVRFVFTRFWCTPTHVRSKPSSDFALSLYSLNQLPK